MGLSDKLNLSVRSSNMRSPVQTHAQPPGATGVLVCSDESILWGKGFGATGVAVGEVCFAACQKGSMIDCYK